MLQTTTITKEKAKEKACRPLFNVRQDSYEHWLNCRRQYITGTDAGTIAGVNKYQTPYQLYMEKKGLIPRKPANSAMKWGIRLQDIIMRTFAEENSLKIKTVDYMLVSSTIPFMAGNLDFLVWLPETGWAVGEVKNLGPYTGSTEYGNGEAGYISPAHLCQLYHYMILTGLRKAVLVALVAGQNLISQTVEYEEQTANALIALEKDFYFNNLKRGIAPSVTSGDNDLLAKLYPKAEKKEIRLPESAGRLIESYDAACKDLKEAEKRKAAAEASLKDLMRDASVGLWQNRKVTWSETSVKRINNAKIRELLKPEEIDACSVQTTYRRFSVS